MWIDNGSNQPTEWAANSKRIEMEFEASKHRNFRVSPSAKTRKIRKRHEHHLELGQQQKKFLKCQNHGTIVATKSQEWIENDGI